MKNVKQDNILGVQERNKDKIKKKKKVSSETDLVLRKDDSTIDRIKPTTNKPEITKIEVIKKFAGGWNYREVHEWLKELGYKKVTADLILKDVKNELHKELDKQKTLLVNQNILILQNIAKKCIDASRYRDAVAAITELNRVLHAYDPKVEVTVSNYGFSFDMGTGEQVVQTVEVKDVEEIEPEEDDE